MSVTSANNKFETKKNVERSYRPDGEKGGRPFGRAELLKINQIN